jgi:hypothetical protein
MPSRSLSLSARAARPLLSDILSTKPSWLPPGAFGLVPPPHDDKLRISVPMIATPNASLKIGNTR